VKGGEGNGDWREGEDAAQKLKWRRGGKGKCSPLLPINGRSLANVIGSIKKKETRKRNIVRYYRGKRIDKRWNIWYKIQAG
jgi:hypothetical protein